MSTSKLIERLEQVKKQKTLCDELLNKIRRIDKTKRDNFLLGIDTAIHFIKNPQS